MKKTMSKSDLQVLA